MINVDDSTAYETIDDIIGYATTDPLKLVVIFKMDSSSSSSEF